MPVPEYDSQYADLNNQLLVCLRGKKMRQAKGVLRRLLRLEYQLMFEEATTAYNSFVV